MQKQQINIYIKLFLLQIKGNLKQWVKQWARVRTYLKKTMHGN